MKRIVLFAVILALTLSVGCKGGKMETIKITAKPLTIETTKIQEVFDNKAKGLNLSITWKEAVSLPRTDAKISGVWKAMAEDRDRLTKHVLNAKKDIHTSYDLKTLPAPYQKLAKILLKAAPHVRHLYMLQMNPDVDKIASEIRASNNPDAIKLFERNATPTCGTFGGEEFLGKDDSLKCAIAESYPKDLGGTAMWPEGMNKEIFDELKANATKGGSPEKDPFLSPFTTVYWKDKEKGLLAWRPFYDTPLFHNDIDAIVKLLLEAAETGEKENKAAGKDVIDKGLINQLKMQAQALLSKDPYPYKASDAAWMKAGGPLKLCIGPYETYNDKGFETKAFFQYALSIEDFAKTQEVAQLAGYKQKHEENVAKIIGEDVYKPRKLDAHETPTPFIRVIWADGEMHNDAPTPIAHNLPNNFRDEIGFLVETFSNHYEAKKAILEEIAKIVIDPEQQQYVDFNSFIDDGHYHEFTHAVGPSGDSVVIKSDGTKSTVSAELGDTYAALEETKADTGAFLFSEMVYGKDNDKFKKDLVTALASLFRSSRFGLEAHGKAGLSRLAFFVEKGAVEFNNGRFKINFDKASESSKELMKIIGRIEATGDAKAAKEFIDAYLPKGTKILDEVRKEINSAGIPIDVDIRYEVTGA